jgi:hypothetical protein
MKGTEQLLTPVQKAEELIYNLGIENAKYLAQEMLIVLGDYRETDIESWKDVLEELEHATLE